MARFLRKIDRVAGLPPGSLVFVGEQKMEKPRIRMIRYDEQAIEERTIQGLAQLDPLTESGRIAWINVDGLHEAELMREIGQTFNLPPLMLEDVLNTDHPPKMEEYDDYILISLKMIFSGPGKYEVRAEQLSLILGAGLVITFQEREGDVFEPVRQRLRRDKGRIRRMGGDYLCHALLDSVFEHYVKVIEIFGDRIEDMEDEVLGLSNPNTLQEINNLKRELRYLRKLIRPSREIALELARSESPLLGGNIRPYLRDLGDLSLQANDALDIYKEMLTDHLNIHNSLMGNKLNEIMKFLTIFSTIFIPLTFIAGIYGANFDYMPELHYKYGYLLFWLVLLVVAFGMLRFFSKKKWL